MARVTDAGSEPPRALPPGQRLADGFPVRHYGPVPKFRPDTWKLTVTGATLTGQDHDFDVEAFAKLERDRVVGDLHCVTKWTVLDNAWEGVLARTLMEAAPPADDVTHVMAWAEYGYSANLAMEDFASARTILATDHNGKPLTPAHGWPLRLVVPHLYGFKGPKWLRGLEYHRGPVRGFWEERGYHLVGDAWREERYSYQE
jgi:DMSO/TMAO reductase YedYZ molybdopterin-dependent catalytic subunit